MTPAQKVRAKFPKAYAYCFGGSSPWVIYSGEQPLNQSLNTCDVSRRAAWASAARMIRRPARRDAPK